MGLTAPPCPSSAKFRPRVSTESLFSFRIHLLRRRQAMPRRFICRAHVWRFLFGKCRYVPGSESPESRGGTILMAECVAYVTSPPGFPSVGADWTIDRFAI